MRGIQLHVPLHYLEFFRPAVVAPAPVAPAAATPRVVTGDRLPLPKYSNFRKYAHPLDVKGVIITEKVFPVFSESFFFTCFGLVMYIWELKGVTEKFAFQM